MDDKSGIGVKQFPSDNSSIENSVTGIFPYCTDGSSHIENSQAPNLPEVGDEEKEAAALFSLPGGQRW